VQDGVDRVQRVRHHYLARWASSPAVRHLDHALLAT
jgi:hypothetical protein